MDDTPRRIAADQLESLIDVFAEAFAAYPVMRFVLGDATDDRRARLRVLVGLFVNSRLLRGAPVWGVAGADGRLVAALTSTPPDEPEPGEDWHRFRAGAWAVLGEATKARYEACVAAWAPLEVAAPHLNVNMVGVRGSVRGRGLAKRLLDAASAHAATLPGVAGVALTTEDPANLTIYRRLGFEVVGEGQVAPGLTTWQLYRPLARAG